MRVWAGRHGLAAVLVLAVTAAWRGALLEASYFHQDDYELTSRAFRQGGWSTGFLLDGVAGHLQPAQQLSYWLVAHHAAFAWGRVAAVVLGVELLTAVVMWHVLGRLLPGRWARVPLLAVFAWSPITLAPTLWWSAAMSLWPPLLCLLLATLFFLRAEQGAGPVAINLSGCVLAVLLGLTWHERGLLAVAVLLGIAVARSERTGWRRVTDAVTRWWILWVLLLAVSVGYLLLHHALVGGWPAGGGDRLDAARAFLLRSTLPGLMSGPWHGHLHGDVVVTPRWVEGVAAALALVVVALVLRRGGPARRVALVVLGVCIAGYLSLVLVGLVGFGGTGTADPAQSADVVAAAVLFLAVALDGPPRRPRSARWSRPAVAPALAVTVTVLYLAGSVVTTARLAPDAEHRQDRRFVATLRADLARDPDQVLLDRPAPRRILVPVGGREWRLSEVLAPLPEHPAFDAPSPKLRAVDDDGSLADVRIVPARTNAPGPDGSCGHAVRAGATVIPLVPDTPLVGRNVVRLEVFTDHAADYRFGAGGWSTAVHVVRGPQLLWVVVPEGTGAFSSVSVTGSVPSTLCVVGVVAGPAVGQR